MQSGADTWCQLVGRVTIFGLARVDPVRLHQVCLDLEENLRELML